MPKDSRLIYIAQNAARHPESSLEPLFRALYITYPSFNISEVDLITNQNNIRKLVFFINSSLSKNGLKSFTIEIEVISKMALFYRVETEIVRFLRPNNFTGFGHEFEKVYTQNQVSGSTSHYRIINYSFSGLRLIVRYETDGYIDLLRSPSIGTGGDLSSMMESLSLYPIKCIPCATPVHSKLILKADGQTIPDNSILGIKTRVAHKPISM